MGGGRGFDRLRANGVGVWLRLSPSPFGLSHFPFGLIPFPFGLIPSPFGLSPSPFGLSLSKPLPPPTFLPVTLP